MDTKKGGFKGFIIVAVIFALIIGVAVGTAIMPKQETTHVSQVFADVNGDGKLDLILSAEVILNVESADFQVSQP